jgi:hypothetical protein
LVPPAWIDDDNTDSLVAAQAHPDRFAVMGGFDSSTPGARGGGPRARAAEGHAIHLSATALDDLGH